MSVSIIKSGTFKDGYSSSEYREILMDSASDLGSLPSDCSVGSVAYTADLDAVYIMNSSHEWVEAI